MEATTTPRPVAPWEEKEWAFDDAMDAAQRATTARAEAVALTKALHALAELAEEVSRMRDDAWRRAK